MRAAIISDTHDAVFSTQDVLKMIKDEGVETIIHCGDMSSVFTAELFHDFCIYHAWGNNDFDTIGLKLTIRECMPGSQSDRWIKGVFDGRSLLLSMISIQRFSAVCLIRTSSIIFLSDIPIRRATG